MGGADTRASLRGSCSLLASAVADAAMSAPNEIRRVRKRRPLERKEDRHIRGEISYVSQRRERIREK
jgi:hypothetical protein